MNKNLPNAEITKAYIEAKNAERKYATAIDVEYDYKKFLEDDFKESCIDLFWTIHEYMKRREED